MKTAFYFLIAAVALISCENEEPFQLDGSYDGVFFRSENGVRVIHSEITLQFENNRFSGSGIDHQSPAICSGTFATTEKEVEFFNECMFTANFDWTLILNGKFEISETADEIILSKQIDSENGDYYVLKKTPNTR